MAMEPTNATPNTPSLSGSGSGSRTPISSGTPHVPEFPFQRLDVYKAARELAELVHTSRISDPELRDQATRAAKGTFLCLCEGLPSDSGPMRRKFFQLANGSLHEAVGALDLAAAIGALDPALAARGLALAARVKRMLRALRSRARSRARAGSGSVASPTRRRRPPPAGAGGAPGTT